MRWSPSQRPHAGPSTSSSSSSSIASVAATCLLLASSVSAAVVSTAASDTLATAFDCAKVAVDDGTTTFDFSALRGPHTASTAEFHPPTYTNTTYTLDLCGPLRRKGEVARGDACPEGTQVCAIRHLVDPRKEKDGDTVEAVIPLAGDLAGHGGKALEWTASRMNSTSSDDKGDKGDGKEGVRIVLKGGVYEGREQRTVVEMVCDPKRKGDEGEWESLDRYEGEGGKRKREDKKEGEKEDEKKGEDEVGWGEKQLRKDDAALVWEGYSRTDGADTLQLTWYTKLACEKRDGAPPGEEKPGAGRPDESKSWGIFTWLVILVFMTTASYLIFGSWLNYNRYGARGWDLLPHGDTLRDLPYLLQDWFRRLLNTMQSSGSRGGYSAV